MKAAFPALFFNLKLDQAIHALLNNELNRLITIRQTVSFGG
jgi:hypothetical protein